MGGRRQQRRVASSARRVSGSHGDQESHGDQGNGRSGSSWSCDSRNIVGAPPGLTGPPGSSQHCDSGRTGPPELTLEESDDWTNRLSDPHTLLPTGTPIEWQSRRFDPMEWERFPGAKCIVWKISVNTDGSRVVVLLADYESKGPDGPVIGRAMIPVTLKDGAWVHFVPDV